MIYFLRRAERLFLLRAASRIRRAVLDADFVRAVRVNLRGLTGFTVALLAFLATCPRAATCPSVEPIFSATLIKTCFSLSTKPLALLLT